VILTVTLNAAIDRTVAVPNFRLGQRHRAVEARTIAGGKGVNVARALRLLERPVIATGLAGGATGTRLLEELRDEQVLTAFIRIAGESRTNLAVVDPTTGEQTEINERGPAIGAEDIERLVEKLVYLGRGASACVLAGSVPPGAPEDIYARLITELRALDVLTVLDTDGEPMRAALRAGPAVVAPNVAEAEDAVGHEFNEMGAEEAIITSETGCVAIVGDGAERRRYEARIDQLDPVTTVGSGDAFLAGYMAARHEGGRPHECLAFGVACGAESTQHFGAGTLDRREVERLLPRVGLRELDVAAEVA
jgi:1-phosphofructokinase family hexose kinase